MSHETEKSLQSAFVIFNDRFFDNRINPAVKVRLKTHKQMRAAKVHEASAVWRPSINEIWMDKRGAWDQAGIFIRLIHEMTHADIEGTYVGQKWGEQDHGMIFQAELVRLFKAGAYDGLF